MDEVIKIADQFEDDFPSLHKVNGREFKVGTVIDPGKVYGLVIYQNKELVCTGEMGESIQLSKKRTNLKYGLFTKELKNIDIFAVKMTYKGNSQSDSWDGYCMYSFNGKHKHHVNIGCSFSFEAVVTRTYIVPYLHNLTESCVPMDEMGGGTVCFADYPAIIIKNEICAYFDYFDFKADVINKLIKSTDAADKKELNNLLYEIAFEAKKGLCRWGFDSDKSVVKDLSIDFVDVY